MPYNALEQIIRAIENDPVNLLFQALYGMDLNYARRFDDAIAVLTKVLAVSPNEPVAISTLRSAYHNDKQFDRAYEVFVQSYETQGDTDAVMALKEGYKMGGYEAAMISLATFLTKRSETRYVTPFRIATLYARAGKIDEANHYLSLAYDEHDPNMPYIAIDPIFDPLKNSREFQALVTIMNFPKN